MISRVQEKAALRFRTKGNMTDQLFNTEVGNKPSRKIPRVSMPVGILVIVNMSL